MINAHFNAHKITNNAQLKAHYLILIMRNNLTFFLLSMFTSPKHLMLFAGGMPSGNLGNSFLEGNRTLFPNKITQTLPPLTQTAIRRIRAENREVIS